MTFTSCEIYSNSASSDAGGVYLSGGTTTFTLCEIYSNAAGVVGGSVGGGVVVSGGIMTVVLSSIDGNIATGGPGQNIYVETQGYLLFVLPVPAGRYLPGSTQCLEMMCKIDFNCTGTFAYPCPTTPCPMVNQICDYRTYGGMFSLRIQNEQSVDTPFPPPCSAGFVGNSNATSDQMYATCAQSCPGGHYCPEGTIYPVACQAGHSSQAGAQSQAACVPCAPGFHARSNGNAGLARGPDAASDS